MRRNRKERSGGSGRRSAGGSERGAHETGRSRGKRSTRGGFSYKKRDASTVKRRAEQGAGNRDQIFKNDFTVFKVQDENDIRILPPTWDDPEHYALDAWVHYQIGSDESAYLCLDKMGTDEQCPICEERTKAEASGDSEYANTLKPTRRPICFVIDRSNESDGPLLWAMPWTVDRDLSAQSIDKKTGEVIPLDDPYDGYDVSFNRTGKALNTKYVGLSIGRHPSPALDDDSELEGALNFIQDNPVTEALEFKTADYISQVFSGHNPNKSDKDSDTVDRHSNDKNCEQIMTWDEVHAMDFDKLEELVDDEELYDVLDVNDFDELGDELADAICEELGIDKPKQKRRSSGKGDSGNGKSRARNMRRK